MRGRAARPTSTKLRAVCWLYRAGTRCPDLRAALPSYSFSVPNGCVRYAQPPFRVDLFPRTSSQRHLVNGVFSEESGNGPERRARCMYVFMAERQRRSASISIPLICSRRAPPWRAWLVKWIGHESRSPGQTPCADSRPWSRSSRLSTGENNKVCP